MQIYDFSSFWLTLVSFFFLNFVKAFFVNNFFVTIMKTIIINVKLSWKDIFARFQQTVSENKLTFMKKVVLHTPIMMHCKPRQVLHDLFSTNQRNGSQMTFAAVGTKFNLKYLET